MITAILGVLSSSAFGSILGWFGTWLNKKEEFKISQLQYADKKDARLQEQAMKRIDIEIMAQEIAGKERITVIQKEETEIKEAFGALAASFQHDSTLKGSPRVESFRASTRPLITCVLGLTAILQTAVILVVAFWVYDVKFSADQMFELVKYSMMWLFFQAGVCIGWWFASRPSDAPPKPPKL